MTVYEGYFREHKYDLLNQTSALGCAINSWRWPSRWCLGPILVVPLFGLVRRLGKSWWVWGAVAA